MEWEKEASYLASLPKSSPYRVPNQYFDDLQSRIQQSIFLEGLEQKDDQGFKVPSGYFESLHTQIEAKLAAQHLKDLVAQEGFQVPVNYFEELQAKIVAKTSAPAKPQPKVRKLWHTEAMKYVSAACFILIAASVLYVNQQQTLKDERKDELAHEQLLYDIDESVIMEHLNENQSVSSTNNASSAEIENYILDNFSSSDLANNL